MLAMNVHAERRYFSDHTYRHTLAVDPVNAPAAGNLSGHHQLSFFGLDIQSTQCLESIFIINLKDKLHHCVVSMVPDDLRRSSQGNSNGSYHDGFTCPGLTSQDV